MRDVRCSRISESQCERAFVNLFLPCAAFVVAPGTVATVVGALLLPRNIATLRKRTNTERSLVACASILNTFPTKAMAVDKLAAKANGACGVESVYRGLF